MPEKHASNMAKLLPWRLKVAHNILLNAMFDIQTPGEVTGQPRKILYLASPLT